MFILYQNMTQAINIKIRNDFNRGMIDQDAVSDSLLPDNAVRLALNVNLNRPIGSVKQRNGTTALGSAIVSNETILGLHDFRITNNVLLAAINETGDASSTIYKYSSGTWSSSLTGQTASLKSRFLTYLNAVAVLNGTDAIKSWTGTGSWTITGGALDVANFPRGSFAVVFNSRVFTSIASTLYYSSIPSSGSISWTSGNGDIDIQVNDGAGDITSAYVLGRQLIIFKERAMYRWDGYSTDANPLIFIGTPSHESVAGDSYGNVYFFGTGESTVGIYKTQGGRPIRISKAIQGWIDAMSASSYTNTAGYCDKDNYYLTVGNITYKGRTYTNVMFVYNLTEETWTIRSYADDFRVFTMYLDNSAITYVGGDTDGNVQTIDSGTTDNGTPIYSEIEFREIFTSRARTKQINQFFSYATNFQGSKISIKIDDEDYIGLGSIKEKEQKFDFLEKEAIIGKVFYFKIICANSQAPFIFDGLEFTYINDLGYGNYK